MAMHNHHNELPNLDEKMDIRPNPAMADVKLSVTLHLHIDHGFKLSKLADTDDMVAAHEADHAKGKIDHLHPETS